MLDAHGERMQAISGKVHLVRDLLAGSMLETAPVPSRTATPSGARRKI